MANRTYNGKIESECRYTARIYEIPKNTDTIILMRSLKNLKAKTCYISKDLSSGKVKDFAIVDFQTKEDLNKACMYLARYFDYTLS